MEQPRADDAATPRSVRAFCQRILASGGLAAKLVPPPARLEDREPGPPQEVERPARAAALALRAGAAPLPRPGRMDDPAARARCLARFAHHELQAVELFAWALLRWPGLPAGLRRGWLGALADEQRHARLYLERLAAHGERLRPEDCSDYFWRHAPAIARAPNPPAAFLAALGLTLEQANLDFSLLYRDAFRTAGDEASARVCELVHEDELRHVRLAATWLRRVCPDDGDEVARYEAHVPFPLSAARAKARRFDAAARRRAGLGDALVEHVRTARSSQERGGRPGRRP